MSARAEPQGFVVFDTRLERGRNGKLERVVTGDIYLNTDVSRNQPPVDPTDLFECIVGRQVHSHCEATLIGDNTLRPMPSRKNDKCTCVEPCKMKPFHNVIEPLFESAEFVEYMKKVSVMRRISFGFFSWAGDGVPNDAHFWGKQDFLTDPQFQGDSEINYFRKTNTDLVTFLQTEGWLCLVRIRKVLRMLNDIATYDETIDTLSKRAGYPVDLWGGVFEKMHPFQCKCAPCSALREVKKQLEKKNITGVEVTQSVIHHVRRCVYRVLISGIDRIFETFCGRRFSVVWYILSEEFDEHYRDAEFEKLCSLIMNDIVAVEPITSVVSFSKMVSELYEGATDLARAVLHKFAVILGSQKMFYTSSMNFMMFYIDSFNMIIRMIRWLENKFRVFNQLANSISNQKSEDKLDFKCLILHALNELVYNQPDVVHRREAALKVIDAYQKIQNSYFGPHIENLEKYLEYIDKTLCVASTTFHSAKLPCKCPTVKVPTRNVIDAALYINPYRDDQFDAPQVFHCYWQDRFIIERSHTPWKILYNNKAKILLRLTVENPSDKNKKLAINVFLAEESTTTEDRIKDQYFALYESRLERLVDFFDVLKQEVIEYYANTNTTMGFFEKLNRYTRKIARSGSGTSSKGTSSSTAPTTCPLSRAAMFRRMNGNSNVTKISVPVRVKRPDKRSRYSKDCRMAVLTALMQKHKKNRRPTTTENLEQLLTFAVKTGLEGSGMLPEMNGEAKDVYVSITSVDKTRRAKADQEFSLHELMSFIIFWYARHGCVTEFEGHTLHRTTFGCAKSSFKESFPLLYKAAEELDAAVGEGLLNDNDLAILEKGLSSNMTGAKIKTKRSKYGLETTVYIKRESNDIVQSKASFGNIASTGFCVTLSGTAEGGAVLASDLDGRKLDPTLRKKQVMTKVPEMRTRMRKTLQKKHTDVVVNPKESSPKVQQKLVVEEVKPTPVVNKAPPAQAATNAQPPKEIDVDELVQLIEGTHIKPVDPNPKKAAKKARQKERKEQERQHLAEEKAKEDAAKKAAEERKKQEELKKVELEKRKREAEEKKSKEDEQRKQKEAAELKKEEQRKKREEVERRKAEEKKVKKDAKKQRREQRRIEEELAEAKAAANGKPGTNSVPKSESPASVKSDNDKKSQANNDKKNQSNNDKKNQSNQVAAEKEFGRLKHEKEQRKREEEEARRMEQLQAQERDKASKKNKKKKKKSKQSGDIENSNSPPAEAVVETVPPTEDVYPTNGDGKIRSDEALTLQQAVLQRQEQARSSAAPTVTISNAGSDFRGGYANGGMNAYRPMNNPPPPQQMKHANNYGSQTYAKEQPSTMTEIDLSQLKLPPGITITKVPPNTGNTGGAGANMMANAKYEGAQAQSNGIHPVGEFHPKQHQPAMQDYHRTSSITGFNSNVMVVESRCSSLDSPGMGMRGSEMIFGANGTRPSSETSLASDRPSSGMDSLCNNHPSPYVQRMGYPCNNETYGKRVPISMSSPFASSRNETPSPAWQAEMNPGLSGFSGMHHQSSSVTPDRHGYWSPTSASPVTFPPANSVSESYIRAQDQQFIKPRPQAQPRPAYSGLAKSSPPSYFGMDNGATGFGRKAPPPKFKPIRSAGCSASTFDPSTMPISERTPPPAIGQIGFSPAVEPPLSLSHALRADPWTPWSSNGNGERFSPEVASTPTAFNHSSPFSLSDMIINDGGMSELWEDEPCEKVSRSVNPYGPIGSNISRRPSNGSNGHPLQPKVKDAPPTIDPSYWIYNRTF